ncbi:LacI family DNA-binding transcriptional regulator [Cellulomonas sp. Leaf395]|uniref:LacI family DNA-binding transcriptional regulator n=1 Tax=Cellulomonas sp. Leaf395 TaxID=1736362 RepID=UPI0006FD6618|nr:LacI family DNA-binding transcriptional regulator [Cellulomonas sp. Leaf395]KQT02263.1 LacI family transcriptional regulator [Cellulomonas sp. Leaf395]
MTTLKDVARASGVSVMTVSNVINGVPRVGAATRERVLRAIDDLGYEVNLTARRLRSGTSGTVALVVPRADHPYFGELAAAFTTALRATGRHLVIEQSGASKEGELTALSQARLQMYDGVLLSAVGLQYADVDRLQPDLPLVLLGEKPMPPQFDQIQLGNVEGARLATAHLLARGARSVALFGGTAAPSDGGMQDQRTQGWRAAHEAVGRTADDRLLILDPGDLEMAPSRKTIRDAVSNGLELDAVFAITDQSAIGVIAGLRDLGLRVPQDVQVIGFDNLEIGEHVWPELTTIDPSNDWLVAQAVRLLERRMRGDHGEAEHLVTPVSLVERGSTR